MDNSAVRDKTIITASRETRVLISSPIIILLNSSQLIIPQGLRKRFSLSLAWLNQPHKIREKCSGQGSSKDLTGNQGWIRYNAKWMGNTPKKE
jgi:hypothetical protein